MTSLSDAELVGGWGFRGRVWSIWLAAGLAPGFISPQGHRPPGEELWWHLPLAGLSWAGWLGDLAGGVVSERSPLAGPPPTRERAGHSMPISPFLLDKDRTTVCLFVCLLSELPLQCRPHGRNTPEVQEAAPRWGSTQDAHSLRQQQALTYCVRLYQTHRKPRGSSKGLERMGWWWWFSR